MYNAVVEVATKRLDVDEAMGRLAAFHPSVSTSPRGWGTARISLPAESLAQACATAAAVVGAALGAEAVACEVMTEAELDAREGFVPVPELLGAAEAAGLLGVSRQRVQQMAQEGKLQGRVVGRSLVFTRTSVEAAAGRAAVT